MPSDEVNRCRICDAPHDPDAEPRPRIVEERDVGPVGFGTHGEIQCCQLCEAFLQGPIDDEDCCQLCGAEETSRSFELEAAAGADEIDVYYGGSLCDDCASELAFAVQELGSPDPNAEREVSDVAE